MIIVDRKTFLQLPPETLYAKFQGEFDRVCIKGESFENDWMEQSITEMKCDSSDEYNDIIATAENGTRFELDLECEGRDGMFDEDQLFVVFQKPDIAVLMKRLERCL